MSKISELIREALPKRLNVGKIVNPQPETPPERGSGCMDSRTFFYVTGCIRHGCGHTEFLGGPSGGMSQNICCAKCGAKYNDTPMGIHSLHSMYDKIADMEAVELSSEQPTAKIEPPQPWPGPDDKTEVKEPDLKSNPLLEDTPTELSGDEARTSSLLM